MRLACSAPASHNGGLPRSTPATILPETTMPRSLFCVALFCTLAASAAAADWKAGAAKVNITPKEFMWMSGYGARDRPAEGKLTNLWAKALALEDPQGNRVVLISLDLVGIDRETSIAVRDELDKKHSL